MLCGSHLTGAPPSIVGGTGTLRASVPGTTDPLDLRFAWPCELKSEKHRWVPSTPPPVSIVGSTGTSTAPVPANRRGADGINPTNSIGLRGSLADQLKGDDPRGCQAKSVLHRSGLRKRSRPRSHAWYATAQLHAANPRLSLSHGSNISLAVLRELSLTHDNHARRGQPFLMDCSERALWAIGKDPGM
jgi:hypothetical protein